MRRLILLVPLALAAAVLAQDASVDELVRKLGADQYEVREQATQALIAMGEKAAPALEAALKSEDLEVRLRAGRALRAIRDARNAGKAKQKLEEGQDEAQPRPANPLRSPGSSSLQMSFQPGKVTVTITEEVDGKTVVNTYEGESLEKLKEEHPELKDRLGGVGGFRFQVGPSDRFDMDRFWNEWNKDRAESIRKWREEMRREVERWQNGLEMGQGQGPREWPPAAAAGPRLGVRVEKPAPVLDAQLQLRGRGLVVQEVEPGSLAESLGLQPYDVLLEVNDREIREVTDIAAALEGIKDDSAATVRVIRHATPQTLKR